VSWKNFASRPQNNLNPDKSSWLAVVTLLSRMLIISAKLTCYTWATFQLKSLANLWQTTCAAET